MLPNPCGSPVYTHEASQIPTGNHSHQSLSAVYVVSMELLTELNSFYPAKLCVSVVFAIVRCPSVRLSVCLSVTFMYCVHMAEDIVKLLILPGSPIILVF